MSAKIAVGRYASMGGEWPWGQQRLRLHTDFKPIPAILFWNLSTGLCFCGPQGNYHLLLLENIKPIIASRMSVWFKLVIQLDWWEGTRWALLGLEPGSKLESGSDRLICLLGISCSSQPGSRVMRFRSSHPGDTRKSPKQTWTKGQHSVLRPSPSTRQVAQTAATLAGAKSRLSGTCMVTTVVEGPGPGTSLFGALHPVWDEDLFLLLKDQWQCSTIVSL